MYSIPERVFFCDYHLSAILSVILQIGLFSVWLCDRNSKYFFVARNKKIEMALICLIEKVIVLWVSALVKRRQIQFCFSQCSCLTTFTSSTISSMVISLSSTELSSFCAIVRKYIVLIRFPILRADCVSTLKHNN